MVRARSILRPKASMPLRSSPCINGVTRVIQCRSSKRKFFDPLTQSWTPSSLKESSKAALKYASIPMLLKAAFDAACACLMGKKGSEISWWLITVTRWQPETWWNELFCTQKTSDARLWHDSKGQHAFSLWEHPWTPSMIPRICVFRIYKTSSEIKTNYYYKIEQIFKLDTLVF